MSLHSDFLGYMQSEGLSKRRENAAKGAAITEELLQAMKNRSAPIISGSSSGAASGGGAGLSSSSYTGPLSLPSMKGGKVSPVKNARISQGWGKSRIKYAAGRHTGMDFGASTGTAIRAVAAGVVVKTGWEGAYGNATHIRHADGTTSFYAHQSKINAKAGQKVAAGQYIGAVGNTGRSFGSHLHFEVRKQDKYGGDMNPNNWFSTR